MRERSGEAQVSEEEGAVLSLESRSLWKPFLLCVRAGSTETPSWRGVEVPPGPETRALFHRGSPGTWEALPPPNEHPTASGSPDPPQALVAAWSMRRGSKPERCSTTGRYRSAKDDEAWRDGRRESERPGLPKKAGNLAAGTRRREKVA